MIVERILENIYRSFDYHEEERIYDNLAQSVKGDLLEEIYLEVCRDLDLRSEENMRVTMDVVDLRRFLLEGSTRSGASFESEVEWVVIGSVTHWGHTHQRRNLHRARIKIEAGDGIWKIAQIITRKKERL